MWCSPNSVKVRKLRRRGLAGHTACMRGVRNYVFIMSEKLNGTESSSITDEICALLEYNEDLISNVAKA
jgi:hypothetical protein